MESNSKKYNIYSLNGDDFFNVIDLDGTRPLTGTFKADFAAFITLGVGHAIMNVNMEHMELGGEGEGKVLTLLPGDIVEPIEKSDDFKATVLIVNPQLFSDMFAKIEHTVMEKLFSKRVVRRSNSEVSQYSRQFFQNTIDNLRLLKKMGNTGFFYYEQVLCQLRTIACGAADAIKRFVNAEDEQANNYNRLETHFRRFISELSQHYRESREVAFYANLINLTPKYLNFVCNSVIKNSCKQLIDNYVVLQLKNELRNTDKTIQEIAFEFHFANQSFLGCYFKKYTGTSPRKFRHGAD